MLVNNSWLPRICFTIESLFRNDRVHKIYAMLLGGLHRPAASVWARMSSSWLAYRLLSLRSGQSAWTDARMIRSRQSTTVGKASADRWSEIVSGPVTDEYI
jgi:hypothetical protein